MNSSYHLRRETPLAHKIKKKIQLHGCLNVTEYMSMCLYDDEHGYYVKQPVLGRKGDFITAPEISQIFGELIGVWCSTVWNQMNSPELINLVELGPGRGFLMVDALRAAKKKPNFDRALSVHLVEFSSTLAKVQKETLRDCNRPLNWHFTLDTVPEGPTLLFANEFLDACPVRQQIVYPDNCYDRLVGMDNQNRLEFLVKDHNGFLMPNLSGDDVRNIQETQNHCRLLNELKSRLLKFPFAALFIDYGYEKTSLGDTLQAIRSHSHEHPLCSPGEADLSVQVDFCSFAAQAHASGFAVDGPITQREFLSRLGIVERTSQLMNNNPQKAAQIETDVMRLTALNGMGTNFKVVGLRSKDLPVLIGF